MAATASTASTMTKTVGTTMTRASKTPLSNASIPRKEEAEKDRNDSETNPLKEEMTAKDRTTVRRSGPLSAAAAWLGGAETKEDARLAKWVRREEERRARFDARLANARRRLAAAHHGLGDGDAAGAGQGPAGANNVGTAGMPPRIEKRKRHVRRRDVKSVTAALAAPATTPSKSRETVGTRRPFEAPFVTDHSVVPAMNTPLMDPHVVAPNPGVGNADPPSLSSSPMMQRHNYYRHHHSHGDFVMDDGPWQLSFLVLLGMIGILGALFVHFVTEQNPPSETTSSSDNTKEGSSPYRQTSTRRSVPRRSHSWVKKYDGVSDPYYSSSSSLRANKSTGGGGGAVVDGRPLDILTDMSRSHKNASSSVGGGTSSQKSPPLSTHRDGSTSNYYMSSRLNGGAQHRHRKLSSTSLSSRGGGSTSSVSTLTPPPPDSLALPPLPPAADAAVPPEGHHRVLYNGTNHRSGPYQAYATVHSASSAMGPSLSHHATASPLATLATRLTTALSRLTAKTSPQHGSHSSYPFETSKGWLSSTTTTRTLSCSEHSMDHDEEDAEEEDYQDASSSMPKESDVFQDAEDWAEESEDEGLMSMGLEGFELQSDYFSRNSKQRVYRRRGQSQDAKSTTAMDFNPMYGSSSLKEVLPVLPPPPPPPPPPPQRPTIPTGGSVLASMSNHHAPSPQEQNGPPTSASWSSSCSDSSSFLSQDSLSDGRRPKGAQQGRVVPVVNGNTANGDYTLATNPVISPMSSISTTSPPSHREGAKTKTGAAVPLPLGNRSRLGSQACMESTPRRKSGMEEETPRAGHVKPRFTVPFRRGALLSNDKSADHEDRQARHNVHVTKTAAVDPPNTEESALSFAYDSGLSAGPAVVAHDDDDDDDMPFMPMFGRRRRREEEEEEALQQMEQMEAGSVATSVLEEEEEEDENDLHEEQHGSPQVVEEEDTSKELGVSPTALARQKSELQAMLDRNEERRPGDGGWQEEEEEKAGNGAIQHKRPNLTAWSDAAASLTSSIRFTELRLQEVIGGGGFGQVWKAHWRGTPVAVKILTGSAQSEYVPKKVLEEFAAEINLVSGMRHPNILLYMGACLEPPNRAIVTELAAHGSVWDALRLPLAEPYRPTDGVTRDGWPLALYHSGRDVLRPVPPADAWPWALVKRVAVGAAQGMTYLHSGSPPVLHRDFKSANLLLDESYTTKVCDFGLSRLKAQDHTSMTGNCGTVQWMAPEVLASQRYAEPADVYSFGIVLWELLARECPYAGLTPIQCAMAVLNRNVRPEIPPWCPPALTALMASCWEREPTARPTFGQVLTALQSM